MVFVKRYFLLFTCMFAINMAYPQWQQSNGPFGGYIGCIATDGVDLYSGGQGGVIYRSHDNGDHWADASIGITIYSVEALAIRGNNIFAGTDYSGVFLSTKQGVDWTEVNNGLTNRQIYALAICLKGYMF
jgi:hypothetical protein